MHLNYSIQKLLLQLQDVLESLTDDQYASPVDLLSGATTGQHVRHIVEFLQELDNGYESGTVNYDRRLRSHVLETNRFLAIGLLTERIVGMDWPDKELVLMAYVSPGDAEQVSIRTTYFRELLYNIEHMVHHMALLRVAITVIANQTLPAAFGVAASTIKFRQTCAQ